MNYKYEKQAKFIAEKVTDVARKELDSAQSDRRLKNISEDSIESLLKIVYRYYSIYNKYSAGGILSCDINSVFEEVIRKYREVKSDSYSYETAGSLACKKEFIDAVAEIDIDLKFEDDYHIQLIENPKYQFAYLGNGGPFSVGVKDEKGIPTRTTYMSKDGEILAKPIVNYYYNEKWNDTYPTQSRGSDNSRNDDDGER